MSLAEKKIREAEAIGDHKRADYWRHIKALVDEAPPLAAETKATLRILLRSELGANFATPRPADAA